jgi:hypothetical protein
MGSVNPKHLELVTLAECRLGMSHECDAAPEGCREVRIFRNELGIITALVFGLDE